MAGQYRFKDTSGNVVAQISASADGTISFSGSTANFSQVNSVNLGSTTITGTATNSNAVGGYSSSAFVFTSSFNTISSSVSSDLLNLKSKSSSVDISITNINSFTASNANTSLNLLTGSLATTGSNTFKGTTIISGSTYIQGDLVVYGSSSIQYISASSVNIGTNIVQLNTANPAVRFAGLTMIDSGSVGGSGSFLYDSNEDEFIFVHRGNGTNVTSSHFVMGPETFDNLGNELYLSCNTITKGTGKEHLVDSCIFDNGTTVCVNATLKASGQVCGIMGTFSCIGIGTNTPGSKLQVCGNAAIGYGTSKAAPTNGLAVAGYITGGTAGGSANSIVNLDMSNQSGWPAARFLYPCGGKSSLMEVAGSGIGINDIWFQGLPATTAGYTILMDYNGAGLYLSTAGTGTPKPIIFNIFSSEKMRIDGCGNVGIGSTPSLWSNGTENALQIKNASIYEYGAYEMGLQVNAFYNTSVAPSGWKYISSGIQCIGQLQLSGGDLNYNVANPGCTGCSITWNTKFNVTRCGFVGIGQPSPSFPLDICSTTFALLTKYNSCLNDTQIRFYNTSTGGGIFSMGVGGTSSGAGAGFYVYQESCNVVRFKIDNSGNTCLFNQLSVGPVVVIGNQGGTDTTVLTGGSGQGSALRMNYAGGSYNNLLAGNGDNYFNCLFGKLNAAGGVKFGSGATTLNYYEQGNWTPRLKNGSFTTNAGASNVGWYTRIGNLVTVGGTLDWGAGSGAQDGNSLQITCLPFASSNTNNERNVGQPGAPAAGSIGFKCTGKGQLVLVNDPGNLYIYLIETFQDGSYITYTHNPLVANAGTLYGFQMTYHI
jgi:hypothetical protein